MDSNNCTNLDISTNCESKALETTAKPPPPGGGGGATVERLILAASSTKEDAPCDSSNCDLTVPIVAAAPKSVPAAAVSSTSAKTISHKLNDINLQQIPTEELLGSVTTFYPGGDAECGHALRTSARVIHKMRMDSIRGTTPPPQDRKDGGNTVGGSGKSGSGSGGMGQAKTPNQQKQARMVWSNQDKNLFFEALNEYGKDFEGIVNYLNTKKRRKDSNSENAFKVKDVRHLYYQFNQKVAKYLHFSDEVKKEAQELYGLINYGEMRKKVPFQNKKYFHKLKDLVYKGAVMIREKGRNIRIKTPSCRALRKLNQLEEWQEEIKLPPRIDVILKPSTVSAWGRVQSLAQNPRVKTSVTLQKRLSILLHLLQQKWRHQDVRLSERICHLRAASANITSKISRQKALNELELCTRINGELEQGESGKILCITPSKDAVIHRPMINLTEFLSSYSICLNSYEQRIGAKVRGEALCAEKLHHFKERMGANSKRQRHDSGSEKHSPDGKKAKSELKDIKEEKVGESSTVGSFSEIFKSPNASSDSADHLQHKDNESSDGEFQPLTKPCLVLVTPADISCDDPDLKSPESNDSAKLSGLSKLKFENDGIYSSVRTENSNDGVLLETEQPKLLKTEEASSELAATSEEIIKTTVKRKEPRCGKRKDSRAGMNNMHFRPLISEETIQKIREGWTLQNVGDMTVGDLYIMFGEENKLYLEYCWVKPKEDISQAAADSTVVETTEKVEGYEEPTVNGSSENTHTTNGHVDAAKPVGYDEIKLSERLKQLLQIANLNEKTGKRRCPCGHVCDRRIKNVDPIISASTLNDSVLFKQPMIPVRSSNISVLPNSSNALPPQHMRYKQSRWWRMRVNRQLVPSQRLMLPPNGFHSPAPGVPGRTNNNNYTNLPKPPTVSSSSNQQVASSSSSSSSSNSKSGSVGNPSSSNASVTHLPNEEDHVTRLLEDKINSFSSKGSNGATPSDSDTGKSTVNITDDNSCLSLFDVSLPSTSSTLMAELMSEADSARGSSVEDENSNCTTISATRILRESPVDGRLIETDINDISLSSFLGHLDAVYESETVTRKRDSDQMNISIISESSVDYIARFEDIAAELRAQQEQDSV
ncbi:protein cramped isoform X2 [Wyeomyia smithii]|uniref:protein cramped isoform X2 n=1 Tax=Wyeomyia smithii TaxID=174621 RepID=UPI002467E6E3|nr:protein cramped isoform X2 [Wyeomyia smithii]